MKQLLIPMNLLFGFMKIKEQGVLMPPIDFSLFLLTRTPLKKVGDLREIVKF